MSATTWILVLSLPCTHPEIPPHPVCVLPPQQLPSGQRKGGSHGQRQRHGCQGCQSGWVVQLEQDVARGKGHEGGLQGIRGEGAQHVLARGFLQG